MKKIAIDFDFFVEQKIKEIGSFEISMAIARQKENWSLLHRIGESYYWLSMHSAHKIVEFAGSDRWLDHRSAMKSAIHDGSDIYVFDNIREFCDFYIQLNSAVKVIL